MSPHKEAVIELDKQHLRPCQISRKLKLSKGTVVGILWRERNPQPYVNKGVNSTKQFFHRWSIDFDKDMHEKVYSYMHEMKIPKTEAVRLLITFGLESLEGE